MMHGQKNIKLCRRRLEAGEASLPNFGNCLPIETTSHTGKSLRICLAREVTAQSQINPIIIHTVEDILLYMKFTLYLSS